MHLVGAGCRVLKRISGIYFRGKKPKIMAAQAESERFLQKARIALHLSRGSSSRADGHLGEKVGSCVCQRKGLAVFASNFLIASLTLLATLKTGS